MNSGIKRAIERIDSVRDRVGRRRAALVAVSGIDASGKSYLARELTQGLQERGCQVALINVDGWLRLPHERFSAAEPARHFYTHAIRFEQMFTQLIQPLRERRCIDVEVDFAEETASSYRRKRYRFADVDVILVEGIYLLKQAYRQLYDVSIWIECSFETALERAVARAQEGLPPAETIRAYETIYFPAQQLHFELDAPVQAADIVLHNDGARITAWDSTG
jgi:uridine kinase